MKSRNLISLSLACGVVTLLMASPSVVQAVPEAICVPWLPSNPNIAHYTYSGATTRLKGIARGDATQYYWEYGDGGSTSWAAISNSYAIEASHAYTGIAGQEFIAVLHVKNAGGTEDTDFYRIKIYTSTTLSIAEHLDVRVNMAIDEGLWYLHKNLVRATYGGGAPGYSQPYGYWNDPGGYPMPATGAAVDAFQLHGSKANGNYDADPYVETVQRALNYILANTYSFSIGSQSAGNPDTNGNGIGLVANMSSSPTDGRQMYIGGICMVALASSGAAGRVASVGGTNVYNRTYAAIVQDMVDFFAWGQTDSGSGRGGWHYYGNQGGSDMSTTQWGPLGMMAAETNMGSTVPAFVRSEVTYFLDYVQYMGCDSNNGSYGYSAPNEYVNCTKQGAGIICRHFLSMPLTHAKQMAAIGFLYRYWNDTANDWTHERLLGNSYSMYAVMKAMRIPDPDISRITEYNCSTGQQTSNSFDWYYTPSGQSNQGMASYLVSTQQSDGSWDDVATPNPLYDAFATGWRILMLLKGVTILPPEAVICDCEEQSYNVFQDIHLDGSCSYHPDLTRTIVSYEWDFNYNGTTFVVDATGSPVTIVGGYTQGTYPMALRVTDDNPPALGGPQTDLVVCNVVVLQGPQCPHANADGPYDGFIGVPLTLDASASWDPDNPIVSYEWDLDNDGLYGTADNNCFGQPDDATGINPQWTWTSPYVGVIGLKVTDAATGVPACSDYDHATVNIGNHAPIADAGGPYQAGANTTITLDGSGSYDIDPGDSIVSYAWDFDEDGQYDDATGVQPNFTVGPTAGVVYDICVKVTDEFEAYGIDCSTVTVLAYVAPQLVNDDGLDTGACLRPGDQITYTLCWDNAGNAFDVHNVTVVDTLPAQVDFVSATGGGVYSAGTHKVTWTVGTLPAYAAQHCEELVVQVQAGTPQGATLTNTMVFDGDETAPVTKTETTTLLGATLKLVVEDPTAICVQSGDAVAVTLAMSCLPEPVRGFQAFLQYNTSRLTFNGGAYVIPGAFERPIITPIQAVGGNIDVASGINDMGGQTPTMADANLVRLYFVAGAIEGATTISFRAHDPPTRFTNADAQPLSATVFNSPQIIIDNTAPAIVCPSNITRGNDAGLCGAFVTLVEPVVSDPGGSGVGTVQAYRGDGLELTDPYPVGTTTITWVATDCAGNTSSCQQTVTIQDTEDPTITCPANVQGPNAALGTCQATVLVPMPTTADNCGVASVTNSYTGTGDASGVYPVGVTTVIWTVTDIHANTHQCSHTVTVGDAQPPTIDCPPNVWGDTNPGVCVGTVTVAAPTTTDNCATPVTVVNDFNQTSNASGTYPLGTTVVHWTATDGSGNTAQCFMTVTIVDDEAPSLTCPATVTHTADPGVCQATFGFTGPTVTDNCAVASVFNSQTGTSDPTSTYPVGTTPVTWTATDPAGNVNTCTHNVVVTDDEPPVVTCGPDVTTNAEAGTTQAYVHVPPPTATDACAVGTMINSYNGTADASDTYPLGTTPVTWTVFDASGNYATCVQNVTVAGNNEIEVTVQLSPIVTGPFNRCITFLVYPCVTGVPVEVQAVVPFDATGLGITVIEIPAGVYNCITARDRLHTLRRTDSDLHVVGERYVADFTGDPAANGDWLVSGNTNDDRFIDIVDFGIFLNQYGMNYGGPDTTCSTSGRHADFSGNGMVGLEDFTFIQINFLKAHEANCCNLPGLRGEEETPLESIPVGELGRYGLRRSVDLNRDGVFDPLDIAAFMNGVLPEPPSDGHVEPDMSVDTEPVPRAVPRQDAAPAVPVP